MADKRNEAVSNATKRLKEVNYKKLGLYLYGGVVLLVLVAMIHLLRADIKPVDTEHPLHVADEEIEAVLASVEGQVSVAIKDIERVLPLPNDKPVWQQNAANWVNSNDNPRIAIVIDDVGLSYDTSMAMTEMMGPLTLSLLPYAELLPEQAKALKSAGHELMVHLPMEPKTSADPGPNALLSTLSLEEFERRIVWNLSRFDGFVGVNNHMGSLLTEQPGLMVRVMVHLRRQGYLFLDSLTSPRSVAARAAQATGVPHVSRDVFLDNERNIQAIMVQLAETEAIARQRGYAIAIGHPYEETLKALEFWMAGLRQKNLTLVPLSQIMAARENARMQTAQSAVK
ncbi:MAG: divergent polysaccharide deacetylase family protein [Kordiimonas sp.]